jgi:hypothetical protein
VIEQGGRVADAMRAFRTLLGGSDMLAYLAMMAPRLVELRHVLKETGSIYLHCDPTASHYLKILMDGVFSPQNFKNEIIWRRADPKGHAFTRFPSTHDVILFYSKSESCTWNPQFGDYDESYLKSHYSNVEEASGRRYTLSDVTNPNKNRPNLTYDWMGVTKVWRWTRERMQKAHDEGRLIYTKSGAPRYKRYLDEMDGRLLTTIWDDIPFINSQAQERLGYAADKRWATRDLSSIKASFPRLGKIPSSTRFLWLLGLRYLPAFITKSPIVLESEGLGPKPYDGNIILLVDRHTASAAEMVTVFAKENNLATIVGEKTAGRLLSATSVKVGHGFRLALPTGAYYTWRGTALEGSPIAPDVISEFDWQDRRHGNDRQFDTALKTLSAELQL